MGKGVWDIVVLVAVLFFSVILHEIAHGWVALKFGDPTAKENGRLTLNPLPHIDLFGTVILPMVMLFLGGPIFGWAKPVPVNMERLHPRRLGEICVSLAGVIVNFLLAVAAAVILRLTGVETPVGLILIYMVLINLMLGCFNLMPIPPLDGSRLWLMWLPREAVYRIERHMLLFFFLLILILPYLPIGKIVMSLFYWMVN